MQWENCHTGVRLFELEYLTEILKKRVRTKLPTVMWICHYSAQWFAKPNFWK